jgi:hypothetical protein
MTFVAKTLASLWLLDCSTLASAFTIGFRVKSQPNAFPLRRELTNPPKKPL